MNKSSGFTLMEILVVVAIIAILASIVVVSVAPSLGQAKKTQAMTDVRTLATAVQLYRLQNGDYPTAAQGLRALVEKPTTPPVPGSYPPNGYIEGRRTIPLDPWKHEYVYLIPGRKGDFEIISYGADGQPGGEGDNADISNWESPSGGARK